ncbi:hypothetical protein BDV41DRAFT_527787 [Aspergillus transmontanensis]|uniref:Uncharacterized protein n=1 Tax=Aspergillus transmontanensis TaxID=1034304 RepID=A0A5N6W8F7_9EURO|nr:hypothetical protein BDV41DRAFT_527787 [Aspergillus transmontanensis]
MSKAKRTSQNMSITLTAAVNVGLAFASRRGTSQLTKSSLPHGSRITALVIDSVAVPIGLISLVVGILAKREYINLNLSQCEY